MVLAAPVTMSPTFVLTDKGREVGRIVGYPAPDFFWALLGQLMRRLELPTVHPERRAAQTDPAGTQSAVAIMACPTI